MNFPGEFRGELDYRHKIGFLPVIQGCGLRRVLQSFGNFTSLPVEGWLPKVFEIELRIVLEYYMLVSVSNWSPCHLPPGLSKQI